eukprot:TRINITY_DN49806_c0_g1_i1.p1 TRINITY_DN49806_c0_g1~~TRINITY_DN49806_c0_g1_i1.p1  ORF type:complete len:390 (-),score=20.47 TRINITY_DN49806_c0_g1_i1:99-1268(-)
MITTSFSAFAFTCLAFFCLRPCSCERILHRNMDEEPTYQQRRPELINKAFADPPARKTPPKSETIAKPPARRNPPKVPKLRLPNILGETKKPPSEDLPEFRTMREQQQYAYRRILAGHQAKLEEERKERDRRISEERKSSARNQGKRAPLRPEPNNMHPSGKFPYGKRTPRDEKRTPREGSSGRVEPAYWSGVFEDDERSEIFFSNEVRGSEKYKLFLLFRMTKKRLFRNVVIPYYKHYFTLQLFAEQMNQGNPIDNSYSYLMDLDTRIMHMKDKSLCRWVFSELDEALVKDPLKKMDLNSTHYSHKLKSMAWTNNLLGDLMGLDAQSRTILNKHPRQSFFQLQRLVKTVHAPDVGRKKKTFMRLSTPLASASPDIGYIDFMFWSAPLL